MERINAVNENENIQSYMHKSPVTSYATREDEIGNLLNNSGGNDASKTTENIQVAPTSQNIDTFDNEQSDNTQNLVEKEIPSDSNTEKNKKTKRIIIGVALGAFCIASGLLIAGLRKPNSLVRNGIKKTNFGNNIKEGLDFAREAKITPMEKLPGGNDDIIAQIVERVTTNGESIAVKVAADESLASEVRSYIQKQTALKPTLVREIKTATEASEAIRGAIELSGTGPTKMSQIISKEQGIMSQIESISPDLAKAINSTRSNCSYSRTIEEATQFLEKAFPGRGYIIKHELGAASIGATYLVECKDGSEIVVKMIKEGVSKESLLEECRLIDRLIPKVSNSAEEIDKLSNMSRELYSGWIGELDLFNAMENNHQLAKNAKRFSVARVLEVSENGQCLIMEKAKGIQMDKLVEILTDYKMNPAEFSTKYAALIEQNPWLANPEKVLKELSPSILRAFDEQFLFLKKGGTSIMHGDPHAGNFFITMGKNGRIMPEFIDTDNCVIRTAAQVKEDLSFFANYFVGNSSKVAEYFVNQCKCDPQDKARLIAEISEDIKNLIFSKKCDITDLNLIQENIRTILKNHGLKLATDNATAMKAELQYLSAVSEAAHLAGGHSDIMTIMKDIPRASGKMIKAGVNPINCIKGAARYAVGNVQQSVGSAYQFVIRAGEEVA